MYVLYLVNGSCQNVESVVIKWFVGALAELDKHEKVK